MKLTGKCKEDFEKWCIDKYNDRPMNEMWLADYDTPELVYNQRLFKHYPKSMQYGVYVDWFDSVGVNVIGDRSRSILNNNSYFSNVWDVYDGESSPLDFHNTLAEALTAAIEKANEIYDERL